LQLCGREHDRKDLRDLLSAYTYSVRFTVSPEPFALMQRALGTVATAAVQGAPDLLSLRTGGGAPGGAGLLVRLTFWGMSMVELERVGCVGCVGVCGVCLCLCGGGGVVWVV
jgi:hypothetical protein